MTKILMLYKIVYSKHSNGEHELRYLSVCSGIEAASVAWRSLGWEAVAFSEIEPFPCAVLKHHYPNVPNLGDMTKIDGSTLLGKIDVLVGGTPCQSFSIAGLRRGLADDRGNLALEFIRIANESDPDYIVWENVPGVLTSKDNAFGCFLAGLAGEALPLIPAGRKWTNAGCVYGPQRTIAWRVLDAQYFGLAQRRQRVFVVACPTGRADPTKILFESEGVRRDSPPCRKAQQDIAGTLAAGDDCCNKDGAGRTAYVPEFVAQAISCKWSKGTSGPAGDEHHNLVCAPLTAKPYADNEYKESQLVVTVMAFHGSQDPDISGDITHPLGRNQGQEVCVAIRTANTSSNGWGFNLDGVAYTIDQAQGQAVAVAVQEVMHVRRLTPLECERLQGFPDGYTDIIFKRKLATDSHRYKALGNSMAVPVMRWIGKRVELYL